MAQEYIEARNLLIPHAERYANETIGKKPWAYRENWTISWNQAFLGEMDRLARETGLTHDSITP
uniref:Uncharacterized protein n=1 Tax=viral metagenome TaxID=1070528 RepID=A0A6H1ZFJ2_9ZZZZ